MTRVWRLITFADISERVSDPESVAIELRHEVELMDGRRVLLLGDRGWSSGGTWEQISRAYVEDTARMCVGPDEPFAGHSHEYMAEMHWAPLLDILQKRGVQTDAEELASLRHDVVISGPLLARIGDP
jgi:hypothetical protein